MKRSPASYRRIGHKAWPQVMMLMFLTVTSVVLLVGFRFMLIPPAIREYVVVLGNPTYVVSWDTARHSIVFFSIPDTAQIQGVFGYGMYPINSLLKLDELDKKNGLLIRESIAGAVGLPLKYRIASPQTQDQSPSDPKAIISRIFSYRNLFSPPNTKGATLNDLRSYARWAYAARFLRGEDVKEISLKSVLVDQKNPDGSMATLLDQNKFDYVIDGAFQDSGIRTEALSVAVYNTTGQPSLGQKIGRLLGHVGVTVVSIGNDESEVEQCIIKAAKSQVKSKTYRIMKEYFGCKEALISDAEKNIADISLYVGKSYRELFKK